MHPTSSIPKKLEPYQRDFFAMKSAIKEDAKNPGTIIS